MSTEEEEIWCECSDDEKYNPVKYKKGTWEPKPEDILKIFEEIKTKKVLELQWKCPGRRSPDSDKKVEEVVKEEPKEQEKEEERKPEVTQFDFDDEGPEPKTVLTPRRTPGSAPKSEKKVARMDKVLKDMMHQRKLQAAEKEARKLHLAKSPRAPGSPARARMGSPAGSPRTPPFYSPNRLSPVRMPGPNEGLVTTPVRAPVSADTVVRPSISEAIKAASPGLEQPASKEESPRALTPKDVTPSVSVSETATVVTPGTVTVRTALPSEATREQIKTEETAVKSDNISSVVLSVSESQAEPVFTQTTAVSETVTQTTGVTTPISHSDKNSGQGASEDMDTT